MTAESIEAKIAELHAADERNKLVETCAIALASADGSSCFDPLHSAHDTTTYQRVRDEYRASARTVLEAAGYDQMSAKLDELAHTHRRYDINGQSYCADHDGHNRWTPYPCAVRLSVDGATAS